LDPLHPILEKAGCVFEEKLGWERPGWFYPGGTAPLKPYDFYGAYNIEQHEDYTYRDLLKMDYSYDFPQNHHVLAKECLNCRNHAALFDMSYFGQYYLTGTKVKIHVLVGLIFQLILSKLKVPSI
jgi:sarcosine dehydrogenase